MVLWWETLSAEISNPIKDLQLAMLFPSWKKYVNLKHEYQFGMITGSERNNEKKICKVIITYRNINESTNQETWRVFRCFNDSFCCWNEHHHQTWGFATVADIPNKMETKCSFFAKHWKQCSNDTNIDFIANYQGNIMFDKALDINWKTVTDAKVNLKTKLTSVIKG